MTYTPPSGDVTRWHHHADDRLRLSGDTINKHQLRCVDLLVEIFPNPSQQLKEATRYHDEHERWAGDPSHTAKIRFRALALVHKDIEAEINQEKGIPTVTHELDKMRISLVDRLDPYLWMLKHAPDLAGQEEWRTARASIITEASWLKVLENVEGILFKAEWEAAQ